MLILHLDAVSTLFTVFWNNNQFNHNTSQLLSIKNGFVVPLKASSFLITQVNLNIFDYFYSIFNSIILG